MVVDRDRELPLGRLLANHILIQKIFDLERLRYFVRTGCGGLRLVVLEDRVANRNAFVADIGPRVIARRRNQLTDNILTLVAEGTSQCLVRSSSLQAGLLLPSLPSVSSRRRTIPYTGVRRQAIPEYFIIARSGRTAQSIGGIVV